MKTKPEAVYYVLVIIDIDDGKPDVRGLYETEEAARKASAYHQSRYGIDEEDCYILEAEVRVKQ